MIKYQQISNKLFSKIRENVFDRGAATRLPEEYKKFWKEWRETTPEPVHYIAAKGNWRKTKEGEIKEVVNVPLPGRYTKELNQVITGGEMIIQGFKQKNKKARRNPHFWMPLVRKSAIYSEVLDKHIAVLITRRAVELIVKHEGFDSYVLKTRACDLGSLLAIRLKRKILLALRDKTLPYDESKNEMILQKYKDYILPHKEIEWYGLTLLEALYKLEDEEERKDLAGIEPFKHKFRRDLIATIKGEMDNSLQK
ncbi:UNVERIFIED_CONTAM: hypothetical protein PYX00_008813 [Menopon gallinae]|uniref:39S ribosomal protein L28, mitochondrial n=1 Tax=Menopon gallinae TaxID=328185 RepID=A0AAW2HQ06_9NEOP